MGQLKITYQQKRKEPPQLTLKDLSPGSVFMFVNSEFSPHPRLKLLGDSMHSYVHLGNKDEGRAFTTDGTFSSEPVRLLDAELIIYTKEE